MAREFELKYALTEQQARVLTALLPKPVSRISMETTYYDTEDHALSARRWTLRQRLENGLSVCTVKTPDGPLGRGEWEWEGGPIGAAIPKLCAMGGPAELEALTQGGVVPVCGARFVRLCGTLAEQDCVLELAVDTGVLTGGGRELPFTEFEVELKSGAEEGVLAFCRGLSERYGLVPEGKSKFARAKALAGEGKA